MLTLVLLQNLFCHEVVAFFAKGSNYFKRLERVISRLLHHFIFHFDTNYVGLIKDMYAE